MLEKQKKELNDVLTHKQTEEQFIMYQMMNRGLWYYLGLVIVGIVIGGLVGIGILIGWWFL